MSSLPHSPSTSKVATPLPSTPTTPGNPISANSTTPIGKPHSNQPHQHNTNSSSKPKPINVFSNDGSFLERFQRGKKEEDEKKKQDVALERKRAFDDRFKSRGKRAAQPEDPTDESQAPPAKKTKELSQYEKEVKSYEGRSLKDQGIGIRPLVK